MINDKSSFTVAIQFDYLKTISIDNSDIMDCYFIEDIYSMINLGKLTLFDRYGIKEYGPLTGDERIIISYGADGLVTKQFAMYRIPSIESVTEFQQTNKSVISIYFSDEYFTNLLMKKFSKSWGKETKASDIVKDLIGNMLQLQVDSQEIYVEPSHTKFKSEFCMPNWNVADTIRWISNRITGTKGKYGYLFYASSDKYLSYVTLDGLLKSSTKDPQIYKFSTTDIDYENKVLGWEVMGVDQIGIKELGGGQVLGFNSSTKSFLGLTKDEDFKYTDAIKKITSLGGSSLFDGRSINNDFTKFNYACSLSGESDPEIIQNIYYNNFIRRYSLQNMVKIQVIGSDKRYAGMKIDVFWPSQDAKEVYNSMDSGMYLIKSITHQFSPMKTPLYTQVLVLIKNAYYESKTGSNTPTGSSGLFGFDFSLVLILNDRRLSLWQLGLWEFCQSVRTALNMARKYPEQYLLLPLQPPTKIANQPARR